ncbi:MAG: 50S ribosomal protein L24 [Fibrobacterota bacterium]
MKLKKNDKVVVIGGKGASGKESSEGRVIKIFRDTDRVLVENYNMIKKHSKPTQKNPQGGIIQREAPVHISNVMLVCPKCSKPARVGKKKLESGKTARFCKKCSEIID